MDWDFDGDEFDEEAKLREETRKILELPELPISATCVRVPVLVGHAEAVWIETERAALGRATRRELLAAAPGVRVEDFPTPRPGGRGATTCSSAGSAATRRPRTGSSLFLVGDNLRKGAALNAIQIAELVLAQRAVAA